MNRKIRSKRMMSEINVVPYIDVMLVLLVIFMITAPLLSEGVEIDLPRAQAKPLPAKQSLPLIISVDSKGQYYLNVSDHPQTALSASKLLTRVVAEITLSRRRGEDRVILVKGDRFARYDQIVHLMVLLQHAGCEKVGLMTDSPDKSTYPVNRLS